MTIHLEVSDDLAAQLAALPEAERDRFAERLNAFAVAALASGFDQATTAYTEEDDVKLAAGIKGRREGKTSSVQDAFAQFAARHDLRESSELEDAPLVLLQATTTSRDL